MSEVNYFLRVLKGEGYPNPNIETIAKMVGYNLEYFLYDLSKEIGSDGVTDFCDKAIEKLSGDEGIKVELAPIGQDEYEFCYVKIYPLHYDYEESENEIISKSEFGDSKIMLSDYPEGFGNEKVEKFYTIQQIIDDSDMGEWDVVDDLLDHIKEKVNNIVFQNCGFGIWWE